MDQPVKELIGKTINRTFTVAKGVTFEGIEGIEKAAADNGLWAYASVETPDSSADIVRIKGIDYSAYHNPPRTHLKILAQHMRSSETTGESFVIGRVEEFAVTKAVVGKDAVPALAFRMKWASSPLAQSYKQQFDEGMLDSFSVGMMVKDYEDIQDGGYDFTKTELMEISAVSLPANPYANVIGTKKEADVSQTLEELHGTVEKLHEIVCKQAEMLAKVCLQSDEIYTSRQSIEGQIVALKSEIEDRLDSIEAGIVVKSAIPTGRQSLPDSPKTDDRKRGEHEAVEEISKTLKRFAGN